MAYSMWDKQPELVLPKIPFELFAGLAERAEKRMDAIDEQIGKTKGLFASLTAAPGHEDMATAKTTEYNNNLNALYDKYKNNLNSREFSREITSLAAQYANDPTVQKITKSYDWYSKVGAPALFEAKNTNSVINAAGIIDKNNNFQQNTIEYNPTTFKLTAAADYLKPIQEQFAIQKENRKNTYKEEMPVLYGLDGQKIQYTKEEEQQWRDAATLKNVVDSTYDMIKNNANAVPGFRYLVADADRQFGNDEVAKEKYIKETIINASEPFKFDWRSSKEKYNLIGSVGDGSSKDKKNQESSTLGQQVTVSLDPYTDDQGNPLTTFEAHNQYATKTKEKVDSTKGEIIKTLFTGADGKSTLPAGKTGFITTDNGQEIDIASLPDAKLQSQARALNTKYIAEQIKAAEAKNFIAHFAEKYKLDPDNIEASLLGSTEKIQNSYNEVFSTMETIKTNHTVSPFGGGADPTGVTFWKGLGVSPEVAKKIQEAYTLTVDASAPVGGSTTGETYKFPGITDPKQTFETRISTLQKIADSLPNGLAKETLNSDIRVIKESKETALRKNSKLYQNFVNDVNNYLTTHTYENQWEYAISKTEDKNALRSLLDGAMYEGQFERAKTDKNIPAFNEGKNATKLFNDLKVDKEFLDKGSYSIRYDTDRGNFVIDVRGKSSNGIDEFIEVFPKNVAGLTEIVNSIDPTMTSKYLVEQKDFFSQMAISNSRYADLNIFDPANNVTGKVRVKRVIEPVDSGARVETEELLFKLPELNDGKNGKFVMKANTYYDLNKFMDMYNTYKKSGAPEAEARIKDMMLNPDKYVPGIMTFDGTKGKLNQEYFPTTSSAFSIISTPVESGKK